MKLDGEFTVNAPRQKVWETLNHVETLAKMIPGGSGLTEVAPDEYQARMNVGIGPIRSEFSGKVRITERDEPISYRLSLEGSARQGWVNGDGKVGLEATSPETTLVSVEGNLQVGGMLARVGQRMLPGVSKQMMQTFFQNVEKEAGKRSE